MKLTIEPDELRPVIEATVSATIERLDADRARFGERLAYSEAEAAGLLGIQRHALRDARLRGEIAGSKVGKRIVYERGELLRFLESNRL